MKKLRFTDTVICMVTGKRGYTSRKVARQARKETAAVNAEKTSAISVYRCDGCNRFHIGHSSRRHFSADVITRLTQVNQLARRVNEQQLTLHNTRRHLVMELHDHAIPADFIAEHLGITTAAVVDLLRQSGRMITTKEKEVHMARYQRDNQSVYAVQWTGDNKDEIERFFDDLGVGASGVDLRFSSEDDRYEEGDDHGNVVQFYSGVIDADGGADIEVDPGKWIVVNEAENEVSVWDEDFADNHVAV